MICPVCTTDMIVVEHKRIEIDYCTRCQGVWFDSGELEFLLKTTGLEDNTRLLSDILQEPEAESSEAVRRCPICRRKMKKAGIGRLTKTHIDVCPGGDGLWFDGGELAQLLLEIAGKPLAGQGASGQIAAFLADVFQGST
ncbi:MAG: zf-TFIIB domain-containing protein [Chloroflexi bacterium]|nr:zf-TFIIB domain-containing protein [Chloroflexota bacterium]